MHEKRFCEIWITKCSINACKGNKLYKEFIKNRNEFNEQRCKMYLSINKYS